MLQLCFILESNTWDLILPPGLVVAKWHGNFEDPKRLDRVGVQFSRVDFSRCIRTLICVPVLVAVGLRILSHNSIVETSQAQRRLFATRFGDNEDTAVPCRTLAVRIACSPVVQERTGNDLDSIGRSAGDRGSPISVLGNLDTVCAGLDALLGCAHDAVGINGAFKIVSELFFGRVSWMRWLLVADVWRSYAVCSGRHACVFCDVDNASCDSVAGVADAKPKQAGDTATIYRGRRLSTLPHT